MFVYILKRIFFMFITIFFIITFLYFFIGIFMIYTWDGKAPFFEVIRSISNRYLKYIRGIVTEWNWGKTFKGKSAIEVLVQKIPFTLQINLYAFIFYVPISFFLGIVSAIKKNTVIDHIISIFTMIFSSIFSLVLIFLLMLLFGYYLGWLPTIYPSQYANGTYKIAGLIIPIIALSLEPLANITRLVRSELIETLDSEFILLARTKGLKRSSIIFRHGLRNSMVPIVPAVASSLIFVLFNSFFIEYIYMVPGVARWFFESMANPWMDRYVLYIDLGALLVITAFYSLLSLSIYIIVDVVYHYIDPRMRIK